MLLGYSYEWLIHIIGKCCLSVYRKIHKPIWFCYVCMDDFKSNPNEEIQVCPNCETKWHVNLRKKR